MKAGGPPRPTQAQCANGERDISGGSPSKSRAAVSATQKAAMLFVSRRLLENLDRHASRLVSPTAPALSWTPGELFTFSTNLAEMPGSSRWTALSGGEQQDAPPLARTLIPGNHARRCYPDRAVRRRGTPSISSSEMGCNHHSRAEEAGPVDFACPNRVFISSSAGSRDRGTQRAGEEVQIH